MNTKTRTITTMAMLIAITFVANMLDKLYSQWLTGIVGASLAVCVLGATILYALLYNDFKYAIMAGFSFGLVSFISSYMFVSVLFQNPLISILPRLFVGVICFGGYKLMQKIMKGVSKFVSNSKISIECMVIFDVLAVTALIILCIFIQSGWQFYVLASLFAILIAILAAITIAMWYKDNEQKLIVVSEQLSLSMGGACAVIANTGLVLPMMFLFSENYGSLSDVFMALTAINFIPEIIITPIVAPFLIKGVRKGLRLNVDGSLPLKKENV